MPKQVIAYNLADGVTKAEYQKYVDEKKDLSSSIFPRSRLHAPGDRQRSSPFQYVAFGDTDDPPGCRRYAVARFGEFLKEWMPKVKDVR